MGYISDKYGIPHETVVKMAKDGIVDWRVEYLYEFWLFYKELCCENKKMSAIAEICLHYKIGQSTFYLWRKRAKELFT